MYADVSDYAELQYHTASTGLIFSSSSMAQKVGGAIGGSAALWLLSSFGYVAAAPGAETPEQPAEAVECLRWLMSFIPAMVAAIAFVVMWIYPLTTNYVKEISEKLKLER